MTLSKIFARSTAIQTSIELIEREIQKLEQSKKMIEKQIQVWNNRKESLQSQTKTKES